MVLYNHHTDRIDHNRDLSLGKTRLYRLNKRYPNKEITDQPPAKDYDTPDRGQLPCRIAGVICLLHKRHNWRINSSGSSATV